MGPSGSGKTTLLSLLGGLLSPDEGEVAVDGVAVEKLKEAEKAEFRRNKIGFVFQSFRLLNCLSALDNVALGLEIRNPKRLYRVTVARELLLDFGLGAKLNHGPAGLSPGERQRVAIARALAGDPPIVLADEPTACLDENAGRHICQILRNQAEQNGTTIVVVSHDPRWKEYASHVISLRDGEIRPEEPVNTQ
jgi:putative ABC transport system ATP-binding protein